MVWFEGVEMLPIIGPACDQDRGISRPNGIQAFMVDLNV